MRVMIQLQPGSMFQGCDRLQMKCTSLTTNGLDEQKGKTGRRHASCCGWEMLIRIRYQSNVYAAFLE